MLCNKYIVGNLIWVWSIWKQFKNNLTKMEVHGEVDQKWMSPLLSCIGMHIKTERWHQNGW
jgi:hypothetical protein